MVCSTRLRTAMATVMSLWSDSTPPNDKPVEIMDAEGVPRRRRIVCTTRKPGRPGAQQVPGGPDDDRGRRQATFRDGLGVAGRRVEPGPGAADAVRERPAVPARTGPADRVDPGHHRPDRPAAARPGVAGGAGPDRQ